MSVVRRIPLVFDIDRPAADSCIFPHDSNGAPASVALGSQFVWISGDTAVVRLYLWSGAEQANLQLPVGHEIVIYGVDDGAAEGATVDGLFESTGFTEVNLGTEEAPVWAYDVALDLNTDELADALDAKKMLTARVDIQIAVAGGTDPKTGRIYPRVLREAYAGTTPPTPADPPYPAPGEIVTKIRGTVAIPSGAASVTVTGLDLGAVPAQVLPGIRKPAAGYAQVSGSVLDDSVSADGFIFELGAATPAAGYKLDYLIIL